MKATGRLLSLILGCSLVALGSGTAAHASDSDRGTKPRGNHGAQSAPREGPGGAGHSDNKQVGGARAAERSPDKALEFLKHGNERFANGKSIHPNITAKRLQQAGTENQGDHASATTGSGHEEAGGHGETSAAAGHGGTKHVAKEVHSEAVTMINSSKLAELDRARHRKVDVAAATMELSHDGMSLLWKTAIGLAVIVGFAGILLKSGTLGNMSVAAKLYTGFSCVAALGIVTGLIAYYSLEKVNEEGTLAVAALDLDMMAGKLGGFQNEFILVGIEDKQRGEEILKEHKSLTDEFPTDFAHIRNTFELDDQEDSALKEMEAANEKYTATFAELVERYHKIEEDKEELDQVSEQMDEQIAHVLQEHENDLTELEQAGASIEELALQTELVEKLAKCELLVSKIGHAEVEFLLDKNIKHVTTMEKELGELRAYLKTVEELVPLAAKDKDEETSDLATLAKVDQERNKYQELLGEIIEDELVVAAERIDCDEGIARIDARAVAFASRAEEKAEFVKEEAEMEMTALIGFVAVLGGLLAFFITRGITKPINRIIAGLNDGADQVNDAAAQVSTASQQSAEGASEQASSLEETSSALEQMAAMTRTNAENAKQANELSNQACTAAKSGDETMGQLNAAMTAINESSGQISKIIKVIEEIAFQTNLLALNAAVEAARAGEHGKGFAVVADEVRNLAQRAAQAARETTGLIEDSTNKAKEGTNVAGEVGKALGAIVGGVTKVADLVDGITRASEEQAQGVDQVNTAVSQMDKVTQQNAAGAEESASAAEELSAQATTVKGMVEELGAIVGGRSRDASTTSASHGSAAPRVKTRSRSKVGQANKTQHQNSNPERLASPASCGHQGGSSDDFMSLDDESMKDF